MILLQIQRIVEEHSRGCWCFLRRRKKKKKNENKCHCHLSCAGIEINVLNTLQTMMPMQREIQVTQNSIGLCQPEHRNQTLMPNCILLLLLLKITEK